MKKLFFTAAALSALLALSCGYEIPEKVSVKMQADYAFGIGQIRQTFTDYLSKKTISDAMGKSQKTKFKVYDYNPSGASKEQQYLMDFNIAEIPIDASSHFSGMGFSSKIKGMKFDRTVKTPDLTQAPVKKQVQLPNINESVRQSARFGALPLHVPEGVSTPFASPDLNINILKPEFKTMTFSAGSLILHIQPANTPSQNFSTAFTITLKDAAGNPITQQSGVDIARGASVQLPLQGKTIPQKMKLAISGATRGGALGKTDSFEIKPAFSDDIQLSKVTGLTMGADDLKKSPIKNTFKVSADDTFVECIIGTDSFISMESRLPPLWTGVVCTPDISLSDAITASDSEFDKSAEKAPFLLNRKLNLEGRLFKAGDVRLDGKLAFALKDADITFTGANEIIVDIQFVIKNVKSITMDFSSNQEQLTVNSTEPLDDSLVKNVESIKFGQTNIKVTYTNTLPQGNDIIAETKSNFFGLDAKKPLKAGEANRVADLTNGANAEKMVYPATDSSADFKVNFTLPGFGTVLGHPYYAVFTGIKLNTPYRIAIAVEPSYDWKEIVLKTDAGKPFKEIVNTGLNASSILDPLKKKKGTEEFFENIDFENIFLYVYCSRPDGLDSLSGLGFSGNVTLNVFNGGQPVGKSINIVKQNERIPAKVTVPLDSAPDGAVIGDVEKSKDYSHKKEITELFNREENGTVCVDYTLRFTDKTGKPRIKITRAEFDTLQKNKAEAAIKLYGRIVFPLNLRVKKETFIDYLKLRGVDTSGDLFDRSGKTDIQNINKFLDVIKESVIRFSANNQLFIYPDKEKVLKFVFDTKIPAKEPGKSRVFEFAENGNFVPITVDDLRTILDTYPFQPSVHLAIPAGSMYLPRNSQLTTDLALEIRTNGEFSIF